MSALASPHYDRQSLFDAQDEMGEWAMQNEQNKRLGLVDARVYDLAERERAQRLRESAKHLLHTDEGFNRVCQGYSFCQGAEPCEGCPAVAEMACTAGEEPEVRPARYLGVAVILVAAVAVLALIGAGAVTGYFGG